ncbi:MAG: SBBP repeat-containing protein [Bacteroidota bacterium]
MEGIKYDFMVKPGGNPRDIRMLYDHANSLRVNEEGELIINTDGGVINDGRPSVFQSNELIKSGYRLDGKTVSFEIAKYDENKELRIDPIVTWSTYFGGSADDYGTCVAIDASGNVFMSGYTFSTTGVATAGVHQQVYGQNGDAYITKFSTSGARLWTTYFGGSQDDYSRAISISPTGRICITGETASANAINNGGFQSAFGGGTYDAFVASFNTNGFLVWSTYFGGSANDFGASITHDISGNLYVTGNTLSTNGIAGGSPIHQSTKSSLADAFLVKFDSLGNRIWSTYYGGNYDDFGYSVKTDVLGNVFFGGSTKSSSGMATSGAYDVSASSTTGANSDGFLVKFNSSGARVFGTYYGGTSNDLIRSIAIDVGGNIFVTGETSSTASIASGVFQPTIGGLADAFASKFASTGASLLWGTYCGGPSNDYGYSAAVDTSGNFYLSGFTASSTGISSSGFQNSFGGINDAFLFKFSTTGNRIWSTYLGGANGDFGNAIAFDLSNNLYMAGTTQSLAGISSTGAFQPSISGTVDGFLSRINPCDVAAIVTQPVGVTTCNATSSATFSLSAVGTGLTYQWQYSTAGGTFLSCSSNPIFSNTNTSTLSMLSISGYNNTNIRCVVTSTCGNTVTSSNALITIQTAPVVTTQPASVGYCTGQTSATISLVASGTGLTYAWQYSSDGGLNWFDCLSAPYSGVNTATLTISGTTTVMSGQVGYIFRCRVSGTCTPSTLSNSVAFLQSTPANITTNPANQSVCSNQSALFTVASTGTQLTYQWQYSTTAGATNASLVIPSTGISGSYATGSVSSAGAKSDGNLVNLLPSTGNRGWAKFNLSSIPSNATITNASLTFTTYNTTTANIANNIYGFTGDPSTIAGTTLYSNCASGGAIATPVAWNVNTTTTIPLNAAGLSFLNANIGTNNANIGFVRGSTATVVYNIYGYASTSRPQLTVNYTVPQTFLPCSTSNFVGYTNDSLTVVNPSLVSNYYFRCIVTGGCAPADTSTLAQLNVSTAPTITSQPPNRNVCSNAPNNTTTFSVVASGTPLTYRWQFSSNAGASFADCNNTLYYPSGYQSATLTVSNIPTTFNGYLYRCVLSTPTCASINSNSATLTVQTAPTITITSQPLASVTTCSAVPTSMSFTASSSGTLTYQWQEFSSVTGIWSNVTNGGIYGFSGATTSTLSISSPAVAISGNYYRCLITSTACSVITTTNIVLLTVNQTTAITAQPPSIKAVCVAAATTISTTAIGGSLFYSWSYSTNNGSTYSAVPIGGANNFSGVSSATLSIGSAQSSLNGAIFKCQISGSCGIVTSSNCTLSVVNTPVINTQPPAVFYQCQGGSTSLTLSAVGSGLTYQWQYSSNGTTFTNVPAQAPFSNTTGSVLGISPGTSYNGYYFRCVLGSSCGSSVTSNVSQLAVASNPSVTINGSFTVCQGSAATLNATPGFSYLWSNGSTTATINPTTSGNYTVTATNSAGCSGFSSQLVTIHPNPSPTISGTSTICSGSSTVFTAPPGYSGYNWSTGTTTQSISVNTANTYTVTVTDANGCTGTASRALTVNASPTPTIQGSTSICAGSTTTWSTTTTYSGYNWSTGSTAPSITVSTSGSYFVTVTNANGCTGVASQTLTVGGTLPSITSQPVPVSVCPLQSATFSVTASGTGLTYQWQYRTSSTGSWINCSNGSNYAGVTTNTLTVSNLSGLNNYRYRCIVYNNCLLSTNSFEAILTVNQGSAPTITANGTSSNPVTINLGNAVALQLNGSISTTNPNISWSPTSGLSSTTIANPIATPSVNTQYTATFTNTFGCTQTASIQINVNNLTNAGTISVVSGTGVSSFNIFDTLQVRVQLTNATNIYGAYAKLKYFGPLAPYLTYVGYIPGTLLGPIPPVITNAPVLTSTGYDFGMNKSGTVPGYSGSGTFYTFLFKPNNIPTSLLNSQVCFYLDNLSITSPPPAGNALGLVNQGPYCFNFTNQVNVWPGDLDNNKTVNTSDILKIGIFYNSTGPVRPNANLQWVAQSATLWGNNASTPNSDAYKVFADGNGDGIINNADQTSVGFNMGKIHAYAAPLDSLLDGSGFNRTSSTGNLLVTPTPGYVNTSQLPQQVELDVSLANSNGTLNNLYGISFDITADTNVFDLQNTTFDYTGSIFGAPSQDFLSIEYVSNGVVSVGMTRFNNASINGNGVLCKVRLNTLSSLNYPDTNLVFTGTVVAANDSSGVPYAINPSTVQVPYGSTAGLSEDGSMSDVRVYPNPANEYVQVQMVKEVMVREIRVVDQTGRVAISKSINKSIKTTRMDVSRLISGVYTIQVISDDQRINQRRLNIIK